MKKTRSKKTRKFSRQIQRQFNRQQFIHPMCCPNGDTCTCIHIDEVPGIKEINKINAKYIKRMDYKDKNLYMRFVRILNSLGTKSTLKDIKDMVLKMLDK